MPPERTGEASGSTAMACTDGLYFFNPLAVPLMVPPVPTPATKKSTFPSVSFHISSAVVCTCASGLAGLSNCPGMKAPG